MAEITNRRRAAGRRERSNLSGLFFAAPYALVFLVFILFKCCANSGNTFIYWRNRLHSFKRIIQNHLYDGSHHKKNNYYNS